MKVTNLESGQTHNREIMKNPILRGKGMRMAKNLLRKLFMPLVVIIGTPQSIRKFLSIAIRMVLMGNTQPLRI